MISTTNSGAASSGPISDGPAAAAGLKPGDVVTAVNGAAVHDPRALARQVAALHPGATAQLAVQRDGAAQTLSVKAEALPEQAADVGAEAAHGKGEKIGLALAPLDQAAREALNVPGSTKGAVIAAVRPDSPASEAGLREGDVLVGVGNRPVATPEEAVRAINGRDAKGALALRVLRDGHSLFVAIPTAQG